MNKRISIAVLSAITLPAFGAIELGNHFSVSGFGSTSWTQSDNDTPLFTHRNIRDESCYDCDTTFGLQLDYYYDAFKASVQVVKRPQDNWSDPQLEWAYVGYEVESLEFRAGRLRLPLFLASEYYYVGQAYTPARPPSEVYNSVLGITAYNGLSVSWLHDLNDDISLQMTPFFGFKDENEVQFNPQTYLKFETEKMWGLNLSLSGDSYRWNFAYLNSDFDQTTTLYNVVQTLPMVGEVTIPQLTTQNNGQNIELWSLGAEYEFGQSKLTFEGQINDLSSSWYVGGQYNYEELTPYVIYGMLFDQSEHKVGDSYTLGVRYDLLYNVSINGEWQTFNTMSGQRGSFITIPSDSEANLYTVMVNFVF